MPKLFLEENPKLTILVCQVKKCKGWSKKICHMPQTLGIFYHMHLSTFQLKKEGLANKSHIPLKRSSHLKPEFGFFLVSEGGWTQGVTLARQELYHLSHSASQYQSLSYLFVNFWHLGLNSFIYITVSERFSKFIYSLVLKLIIFGTENEQIYQWYCSCYFLQQEWWVLQIPLHLASRLVSSDQNWLYWGLFLKHGVLFFLT
jgi:hypothetical protein